MLRNAWIAIILYGLAWNACAVDNVHLTIDSIENNYFRADKVTIDIQWHDADRLSLQLTAGSATSRYFERLSSININCVNATYENSTVHCSNGVVSFQYRDQKSAKIKLAFDYSAGQQWQINLAGLDIDLPVFSALVQNVHHALQGYQITGGRLHGRIEISGENSRLNEVKLDSNVTGLSIEGETILQDVAAKIDLDLANDRGTWKTKTSLLISEGAMYIVPGVNILGDKPGFYIEAGNKPLSIELAGRWDTNNNILYLDGLDYIHPDILDLQASAEIDIADTITLPVFSIRTNISDIAKTFPVYIQPLLLKTNFSNLETAGGLALELNYQHGQLERLELDFGDIYLDDNNNRFSLADLAGNLSIHSDDTPVQSFLRWDGMSFHRLDFGAGAVLFESVASKVNVLHWNNVDVLDGKLEINKFNMENIGTPEFQMTLDANLTPISMKAFTQAMQWPLMSGTLSGTFKGLRYSNNNLHFNGDIDIHLFDGDVVLRNLLINNIFSEYSRLTANIDVKDLDLQRLTDTFTFGKIEGTLNGHVNDLVLENWQPVHFDAAFQTPMDDDKPHRISQKALNNLSSLGGGLSGTMSRGLTRFFQEYSYGQIGLGCRLNSGVCELSGVQDTGKGFYLLTQGGLLPPWVEIKGTGRSIQWTHLVDGLKQIIQGEVRIE